MLRSCKLSHSCKPAALTMGVLAMLFVAATALAEPTGGPPHLKLLPRPAGAITLSDVSQSALRKTIEGLISCGTRHSLPSWTNPKRGIGCGRDHIVAEFNQIARESGGRLKVMVDHFEAEAATTGNKMVPLENVYAILPGSDPVLAKTAFVVSGHFDSRATNIMAPSQPRDVWLAGEVTPSARISWSAPDGPYRAGFELLRRGTTNSRWSVFAFVKNPETYVFKDLSTDNYFFAVRFVGKNGARSIAVQAVLRVRR